MTAYVVQRTADGRYFNGWAKRAWSTCVSAALAFASEAEARFEMEKQGFRCEGLAFLVLPRTRRSPPEFAKKRPS